MTLRVSAVARTSSRIWLTTSKKAPTIPATINPRGPNTSRGMAGDPNQLWTADELKKLRHEIEESGLVLAAIENLDPAHWHDILLDGPQRTQQIENVKTLLH